MPSEIGPRKLQAVAHRGIERFENFRNARLLFLRNYVGAYYDQCHGNIGSEALNLIFNAIRSLIPHIVMSFPKHSVTSEYLAYKEYAELLALALSKHDKKVNITDVYRRVIVDAVFTLGILKTGLAESDSLYAFDTYDQIDNGELYTLAVDFDNFVVDPDSREHMFIDAAFMGDRICVAREVLLESGRYNNELVERLPSLEQQYNRDSRAYDLSMGDSRRGDESFLREKVEVLELWVPEANAIVTVPGAKNVTFEDYLRVDDYYGPDTGPYTLLALTPPVPGNPLPVPAVGVWNDLHVLANKMVKKIVDQAMAQKDVLTYRRSAADDTQELVDAKDGSTIAMDDPDGAQVKSLGGQQQSNEIHLAHLQNWFNMMASNPEALAGQRTDVGSATEAKILAGTASVGLEDMKDLVYKMAAEEGRKRAWYIHTDPMLDQALVRRVERQPTVIMTAQGPMVTDPGGMQDVQVFLTPEARRGDFIDYHFEVQPESMGRKDSQTRFMESMDFAVKILPAATQAAQTMLMMGIPFDVKMFIMNMARDRGIEWMDEVWYDPMFQMKMAMQMMQSPQPEGSKGEARPNANPMAAIMQNGQPGQAMGGTPDSEGQMRSDFQSGANDSQRQLKQGAGY
jgi:hypothetical protein